MFGFSLNKTLILLILLWLSYGAYSQNGSMYLRLSETSFTTTYSPDSLSDLWFWLDADDSSTIFNDAGTTLANYGDPVYQWNDKSGNNFHVSQATIGERGTYTAGAFNGRDVIDFDLTDRMEHILSSVNTGSFSLFIVLLSEDPTPNTFESFFSSYYSPGAHAVGSFQIDYLSTTNNFRFNSRQTSGGVTYVFAPFVDNQIKLFSFIFDSVNSIGSTYDNGVVIDTKTTTDLSFSRLRINQNRKSNRRHDSQIGEILIFDKVLSNCELYKVTAYLNAKYTTSFAYSPSPGGADCESIQVWLRADSGTSTTTDGVAVSNWNDVAITATSFQQSNGASQPIYRNNATDNINYNPTVDFTSGTKLLKAGSVLGSANSELTALIVSKEATRTNNFQLKFKDTEGALRYSMHNPWSDNIIYFDIEGATAPNRISANPGLTVGRPYLTTLVNSATNNTQEIYFNGGLIASDATGHSATGLDSTTVGKGFNGDIPEVIIFEADLSDFRRNVVESYLAIKYGLTLSHNYFRSDSVTLFDVSTYSNGIVGVGRDDATALNQTRSYSESDPTCGVTLELTTAISNGVYLLIGHDGAVTTRTTLAGETNALTRKYYANQTGGTGTINIEFDLASIGAGTSPAASDVKILIANNGAFTNANIIEASSVVGGIAYFEGIPLYDKHFTFAIP